ncbi:MAG: hypothetical protein VW405_00185 [Rhodospirillaceae bacterium]
MALKARIDADTFAGLDEGTQGHYAKNGTGYVLSVESVDGWALEDVAGLRDALAAERKAAKTATSALKAFDGLDADAARAAIARIEELGDGEPDDKSKAQIEAIRKQLTDKYEADLGAREETIGSLNADIERLVIDSAAVSALAKHKADADLLLPHVKAAVKVERDDSGKPVARVYRDGVELISMESGAKGRPMDLEEFVGTELRQRFPAGFPGSGASGSGATGSTGGGGGAGQFTITQDEARDPRAFQAKYAAATEAGAELRVVSN